LPALAALTQSGLMASLVKGFLGTLLLSLVVSAADSPDITGNWKLTGFEFEINSNPSAPSVTALAGDVSIRNSGAQVILDRLSEGEIKSYSLSGAGNQYTLTTLEDFVHEDGLAAERSSKMVLTRVDASTLTIIGGESEFRVIENTNELGADEIQFLLFISWSAVLTKSPLPSVNVSEWEGLYTSQGASFNITTYSPRLSTRLESEQTTISRVGNIFHDGHSGGLVQNGPFLSWTFREAHNGTVYYSSTNFVDEHRLTARESRYVQVGHGRWANFFFSAEYGHQRTLDPAEEVLRYLRFADGGVFFGRSCVSWNTDHATGRAADAGNWLPNKVPGENDCVTLYDGIANRLVVADAKWKRLIIESGEWVFAPHEKLRTLEVAEPLRLKPSASLRFVHDDSVAVNTWLTIRAPSIDVTNKVTLAVGGTVEVDDFALQQDTELIIKLREVPYARAVPLFRVVKQFLATGKLKFETESGYIPKHGDRFRLFEFPPTTKTIEDVAEKYRFKTYNTDIEGKPDLFWGLVYREEDEKAFIELVVLKVPTRPDGQPIRRRDSLVFLTHGTKDSIASGPAGNFDTAFGAMAFDISTFLQEKNDLGWEVVTFDWGKYSTSFLGENGLFYDAAVSAQYGIGIAESLHYWMTEKGFVYRRMHLLGHSSGSWLVNRLAQLNHERSSVHLTMFDAFNNPNSSSDCVFLFCDQFDGELGEGLDTDDFAEHYVHTSPLLPGTNDLLPFATNVDVSLANITFFDGMNPDAKQNPSKWEGLFDSHKWPFWWYHSTIKQAQFAMVQQPVWGFRVSPEYLDYASTDEKTLLLATKSSAIDGGSYSIGSSGQAEENAPMPQDWIESKLVEKFDDITTGNVAFIDESILMLTAPPLPELGSHANLQAPPLTASLTRKVQNDRPATALRFTFRFQNETNAVLSVAINGETLLDYPQSVFGQEQIDSGAIELPRALPPGTNTLSFILQSSHSGASVSISHLELGMTTEPYLHNPSASGTRFRAEVLAPIGTVSAIQGSTDLSSWRTLFSITNSVGAAPIEILSATNATTFFRAVTQAVQAAPVFDP
jgi:hypothetical protein